MLVEPFLLWAQHRKSSNILENIHHKSTFISELTTLSNEIKEKNKEENKQINISLKFIIGYCPSVSRGSHLLLATAVLLVGDHI